MNPRLILIAFGFGFLAGYVFSIVQALADDTRTMFCAMLSRELVRVEVESATTYSPIYVKDVLHYIERKDESLRQITPELALKRYTTHKQMCESMIDTLPSLPSVEAAGNEAWARSVVTLASRYDGVAPASDAPPGPDEWREACALEYRTWDPDTETVVRKGSPERVKCPLVLTDGEWKVPE